MSSNHGQGHQVRKDRWIRILVTYFLAPEFKQVRLFYPRYLGFSSHKRKSTEQLDKSLYAEDFGRLGVLRGPEPCSCSVGLADRFSPPFLCNPVLFAIFVGAAANSL